MQLNILRCILSKVVVCYALLFCVFSNLFAQIPELTNASIDSLKLQIEFVSDSAKVDLLNKIAYDYYYFDHDSTEVYALLAIELASSLNYLKGISEGQRLMGIANKAENNERVAIEWLFKGLETATSINYHQGIADNMNSIGIFFSSVEDYNQALSYFKGSVAHQKMAKNPLREGILYSNIGNIFLKRNLLDSSQYYFQKSEVLLDSIGDEKWVAMVKSQYGGLLLKLEALAKAEEYSKQAAEISIRLGQSFHLRKSYQNLAEIYTEQFQYVNAQEMADLALSISEKIGFIPFLIEAYQIEYKIKLKQNQFESALFYHEKYAAYKDSLKADQLKSEVNLIKFQTELEQKEKENIILRKEKEIQDSKIERQSVLGAVILIILVIITVLAFIFFRLREKERGINTKMSDSNKLLEEQKEELTATLQMVEHLNAQLQAQNNTLNKAAIVSITDLGGNIISVNENYCQVTGYSRDELLGINPRILKSDEHTDELYSTLWKTITSGKTWRGELKNKKKNGGYFWADTAIAPVFNDNGKPKQFFCLQFDVTRKINYLDQLTSKSQELEDLNELKDKLLSIVSHDFRSPLNSLRGTLSLFLKGVISNEELNMLTEDLVEKLDNTYNLLENLLNWAKSQMQGMKVYAKNVDLKTISEDCVGLLSPIAEKKLVKITNGIKIPTTAFADNEMVKLITRNLIYNAIKFTTAGNEIILDTKLDTNFVTISVKDNGAGISNENQEKLFKNATFTTRGTSNESGMGLGLLLCKDFVDKNGGKIWFESELEKGTTFFFTLPLKDTKVKLD